MNPKEVPNPSSARRRQTRQQSASAGYRRASCTGTASCPTRTQSTQAEWRMRRFRNPTPSQDCPGCILELSPPLATRCLWRRRTSWRSSSFGAFPLCRNRRTGPTRILTRLILDPRCRGRWGTAPYTELVTACRLPGCRVEHRRQYI